MTQKAFARTDVEKTDTNFLAILNANGHDEIGFIALFFVLLWDKGAFGIHLTYFTIHHRRLIIPLPLLFLFSMRPPFSLLDDGYLVSLTDQHGHEFVQTAFLKPGVQLLALHPAEVQDPVAEDGIIVEDLVELADLEEEDFVEVFAFDVPVLLHTSTKLDEFIRRHE